MPINWVPRDASPWLRLAVALLVGGCPVGCDASSTTNAAGSAPASGSSQDNAQAEKGVRAAFEAYRAAVLARDGQAATATVDRKTIELYETYLTYARTADRKELKQLDLMAKFIVLRIRHEFDAQALSKLTGVTLFAHGVTQGWVSDAQLRNAKITRVKIRGPWASVYVEQAPTVPVFHFSKDGSRWKFAIWKAMVLGEAAMKEWVRKDQPKNEEEWVAKAIESVSPKKFDRALLDGPPQ